MPKLHLTAPPVSFNQRPARSCNFLRLKVTDEDTCSGDQGHLPPVLKIDEQRHPAQV